MSVRETRLSHLGSVTLGKMVQSTGADGFVDLPYVRAAHIQPMGRWHEATPKTMPFSPVEARELDIRRDDVLIVEGGAGFGRAYRVAADMPGWGFQNSIVRIRPKTDRADGRFVSYALQSALNTGRIALEASVATIPHFTAEKASAFRVPAPDLHVQSVVADLLDRETAKIDALIAKQDALGARLRERHRAAIAQAVEAVLDPSSGARFKHFVTEMRQGWSPQCESVPADGVTEWGVLKTGCVNGGVFRPEENKLLPADTEPRPEAVVRRGEIVMSRASTRDLVGSAAVVEADYPRLMLSDKTYAITVDRRIADPWFVSSLLGTPRIRQAIELEATGASHSMQNVSKEDLLNLPMPLPPVGSQVEVVRALQVDAPKVDAMVGKAQQLSAKLKERRAALITAAVTGKLDVTTYGKAG
jgi:type I restriction enzyme S subunit